LYQRFKQRHLELSPLASRAGDVPLLARHFVGRFGSHTSARELSDEAMLLLQHHGWPGNVAELEECIEHACARAQNGVVHADDLPRTVRDGPREPVRDIIPAKKPQGPPVQGTHSATTPPSMPIGGAEAVVPRDLKQWDITEEDPA